MVPRLETCLCDLAPRNAGAPGRSLAYIISAECQSPSSTDILADASMKSLSPEA